MQRGRTLALRGQATGAPILPTRMPELTSPSAQLKSYLQAAEIARECHTNPPRQIHQPQPMYPCERTVASDQEWSMTPQFSMSPATSVDSQPLLDSPASRSLPWAPFIASPDPHLLQQDSRVGYISSYSNLFDFRDSQPNECMDASRAASSATSEEMAEKHICFDESTPLSPLDELGVKPYGTADDLDTFVSLLTWEVVAEGTVLEF
ncbi:hypothetical protein BJ912DRAFT_651707 [Pholiota molesta]|nr:hypothetical protein BJ912DRAFT_651707 [Pholiota molesta]